MLRGLRALCAGVGLACLPCLLCMGCGHVHPYEREYHSRANMQAKDEKAETGFQAHLRESREGATSGSSAAGGGCGCN
jgi:hypothetical protein